MLFFAVLLAGLFDFINLMNGKGKKKDVRFDLKPHHLRLLVGQGFCLKQIYPIPYYILPENYTNVLVPGRIFPLPSSVRTYFSLPARHMIVGTCLLGLQHHQSSHVVRNPICGRFAYNRRGQTSLVAPRSVNAAHREIWLAVMICPRL